ncbi:MAG: ATP-binding protein, partial [Chloroflexota bacterium]
AGIPEEIIDKIFNPGFSTKRRQFTRLTGIGLYVCRKIAQDHGGSLLAESEPDKWTRFTLELPKKAKFN